MGSCLVGSSWFDASVGRPSKGVGRAQRTDPRAAAPADAPPPLVELVVRLVIAVLLLVVVALTVWIGKDGMRTRPVYRSRCSRTFTTRR